MAPKGEIETHTLPMNEVSDIKKPSVDSRFSVEAHGDPKALKKEFHTLAKQYHPDTADIPEATELFQEISAEYEQLQANG